MAPPRLIRYVLAGAFALAAVLFARVGAAQTITITENQISRNVALRPQAQNPMWISRADCLADDVIHIPLGVSSYQGYAIEAWASLGGSGDCRLTAQRGNTNPTCWKVGGGQPTSTSFLLDIRAQDVVGQHKPDKSPSGVGAGTADDCLAASGKQTTSSPQAVTIYVFFLSGTSTDGIGNQAWKTSFDLVGPTAASSLSLGQGDTLLVLNWGQSKDTDLVGYQFFCDPVPGTEGSKSNVVTFDSSTPLAADAEMDTSFLDVEQDTDGPALADGAATDGDSGAAADAPADAVAEDDAADVEAGDAEAGDAATASTGNYCSSILVQGADPDGKYLCGSVSGSTSTTGRITGLINYTKYAVAIAAVDGVGNVGKLSNVECTSPNPVDDFFKLYRQAGGQGGGSFCAASGALGHAAGGAAFAALALAGVARLARRRRGR
jgi:hypothetical protein